MESHIANPQTEDTSRETHINDVIQECLENIFMYLNCEDLINVANVSQYFRNCAYLPFTRKYSEKMIEFPAYPYDNLDTYTCNAIVKIKDFRIALRALRCFGHLITNINMTFSERYIDSPKICRNNSYILHYINEYCTESLLKLSVLVDDGIDLLQKPFLKVEEIYIGKSCNVRRLNELFPKLRRLTLYRANDISRISTHFPNLEHLKIHVRTEKVKECDGFESVLRFNPQLRSLSFSCYSKSYNMMETIRPYLQSIEALDLGIDLSPIKIHQTIHLPNALKFRLYLNKFSFYSTFIGNIPFLCNRLKEFTIGGEIIANETFYAFISEHPTIEKLTFEYKTKGMNELLDKQVLMKALPSLREIEFLPIDRFLENRYTCMSIDFIIELLKNTESVKRCTFYCLDSDDYIKSKCGNEWKSCITVGNFRKIIVLERIM